jgi:hypothetical protein
VADAYYASGKIVRACWPRPPLDHPVRSNSIAFFPAIAPSADQRRRRGRPTKYGKKIKVASLAKDTDRFQEAPSPVYGERGVTLRFRAADLLWRPVGILVRFVVVHHPHRGVILLMCTDLTLSPLDIIRIYGLRFKIEVSPSRPSESSALCLSLLDGGHDALTTRQRQQYMHHKSEAYRNAVRRKIAAYHRHIQLGLIAQGLLQISPQPHPSRSGAPSAPGSAPFGPAWPPPNRSWP